ncbi:MAG: methylated-DNA--[protein]-cysteine S-methyltransferase [Candidatus Aenigmarchaeota archaeon]|nr:methylated-DNA--[protein]-cysteine S-methyltransferase [Candidatus Aenigmarchaeota archaeon]
MIPRVYEFLRKVPKGRVTTYKELAKASGTHPRTVGLLMKKNKDPVNIPCYKVVRSDGSLGGYSAEGGVKTKIRLLRRDGIEIRNGKINLKKYLFKF